jgi:serine/threonine protein kinase/tetratricopeptide (TPR) repeat protein
MKKDGKTWPDSSGPLEARRTSGTPQVNAAQTPPPESDASDAPTLAHSTPSPFSPSPVVAGLSDQSLGAMLLLLPGTLLGGRYSILRLLGQGGMGAVYKARDLELDRVIALKVIRPELAGNPGILQRFKQELILARHITHKNVIRIYDLGDADGLKFITMEYVDGEDLRALLRHHNKFSPADAVKIIQQICRALEAAHAEGVIHRDLKPQNVMRDSQGRIVVMDFGLARSLEAGGMTQTGALVGTLEYMSPEQALGAELDQRSDLFAVGLIFYELLTGKAPYKADTAIASLMKRTHESATPASDVDNSVPKSLSAIVGKCLEREPKHRFAGTPDLLRELDAWQAHPNAHPSWMDRLSTPSSRSVQISVNLPGRQGWVWLGAAVALLTISFLVVPATRNLVFHHTSQNAPGVRGIPELSQGKYVAVLPLRVMGDEKSLRYLADGVFEALSAKMFQLQEVHVASSSAVEKAIGHDQPIAKVAQALGVNLILQGTLQGSADKLRITLDLEDVAGGRRVWSQEFSGMPQDLLTLEDQIYVNLVKALELKPSNEEIARSGVHPTDNMAAYDLYLKGRSALREAQSAKDTQAAIVLFEQALKQDANFALAYTGLADADLRMYKNNKDTLYAQRAVVSAQQAERLNGNLPEVHLALGSVYNATGKNAQAIEELNRALQLTPNSDEGQRRLAKAYFDAGRKTEAIATYQKAIAANPYYWANHNVLGNAYFQMGETGKALQEYRKVTELASENSIGYENIGAVYFRLGQWNDAIPAFQKALTLDPDSTTYSNLGTAYFFLKRYDDSVKMFEKAVEKNPKDEQLTGNLADAYRWSGRAPEAKESYDKAIQLAFQELQVNPKSAAATGDVAVYYAKNGDQEHALQYIRQARSIDASDLQLMYYQVQIYTLAGKQAEALSTLREAFKKGYSTEEALNDPELGKLKSSAEFARLVNEFTKKKTN